MLRDQLSFAQFGTTAGTTDLGLKASWRTQPAMRRPVARALNATVERVKRCLRSHESRRARGMRAQAHARDYEPAAAGIGETWASFRPRTRNCRRSSCAGARDLDLSEPPRRAAAAHRLGIGDREARQLRLRDRRRPALPRRVRALRRGARARAACSARSPADAGRRADKPDLEALTALPPIDGEPYGGLLGLGRARRGRDRGFFWALARDGAWSASR